MTGKNIGLWTEDCEQWFKDRDRQYRANPIAQQPLAANRWRSLLNLFRREKAVVEAHRSQLHAILADSLRLYQTASAST
jgi:hypothetical protein